MTASTTPRSRVAYAAVAFATLLAMAAALLAAAPAQATFPGRIGLILFTRGGDLYTANSSGGAVSRLTTTGDIAGPKWSPSGKAITYRRGTSVYTRTYPGGSTRVVATGALSNPQWSPDGTRIAYLTTKPTSSCGDRAIYTVPSAGGTPTIAWDPGEDMCPGYVFDYTLGTYVPDGRLLLTSCLTLGEDSSCGIGVISMDGTNTATGLIGIGCYLESPDDTQCTQNEHLSDARTGPAGNAIYFSGKGGYDAPTGTLPGSTPRPTASTLERVYSIDSNGAHLRSVSTATSGYSPTRAPAGNTMLFTQKSGSSTNIMKSTYAATSTARVFFRNGSQPDWQPAP